jgi:hypothetical protein
MHIHPERSLPSIDASASGYIYTILWWFSAGYAGCKRCQEGGWGGDPVKGGFQTHKQFSMKCYKSVNQLMMRAFCLSGHINESNALEFPTDYNCMRCIIQKYWEFKSLWEQSVHEPSRMAALF